MRNSVVSVLGVLSLLIGMVSSRTVYVLRGEDITGCMTCLHPDDTLELYRECGIKEPLLMFLCHDNSSSLYNSRILDTSGLCWTLLNAGKNDSCLYKIHYHSANITDPTTEIRVVDQVLLFNITTFSTRLDLDMAVSVNSSAGRVTWEVDRRSLRLIDDNRTLIIPNVRRDTAERRFHARLTNPISEDKWDCQLKTGVSDPVLISEITCNISRLGEETAVIVQSTEESTVTWEVDGEPLPERYRLIDDNRTLIIPGVQRDDAERRCRIGITYNKTINYWRESRVPDPVFIYNITSNCSRLGEETAVSVHFSGEESAVTWEVDGEPLPKRYRLIDDNRTLIIPGVQRDDAERRFRVRITNPVSEEIREYWLINDTMFIRMLEAEDQRNTFIAVGVVLGTLAVGIILFLIYRKCSRNRIPETATQYVVLYRVVPPQDGSVPTIAENGEPVAIIVPNGSAPRVTGLCRFCPG